MHSRSSVISWINSAEHWWRISAIHLNMCDVMTRQRVYKCDLENLQATHAQAISSLMNNSQSREQRRQIKLCASNSESTLISINSVWVCVCGVNHIFFFIYHNVVKWIILQYDENNLKQITHYHFFFFFPSMCPSTSEQQLTHASLTAIGRRNVRKLVPLLSFFFLSTDKS